MNLKEAINYIKLQAKERCILQLTIAVNFIANEISRLQKDSDKLKEEKTEWCKECIDSEDGDMARCIKMIDELKAEVERLKKESGELTTECNDKREEIEHLYKIIGESVSEELKKVYQYGVILNLVTEHKELIEASRNVLNTTMEEIASNVHPSDKDNIVLLRNSLTYDMKKLYDIIYKRS
jgi:undecaprenyl pyrophosphate synthase